MAFVSNSSLHCSHVPHISALSYSSAILVPFGSVLLLVADVNQAKADYHLTRNVREGNTRSGLHWSRTWNGGSHDSSSPGCRSNRLIIRALQSKHEKVYAQSACSYSWCELQSYRLFQKPESELVDAESVFDDRLMYKSCSCVVCGRRNFIAWSTILTTSADLRAAAFGIEDFPPDKILKAVHPTRPSWYEEFYAQTMDRTMISYEAEIAGYKRELFAHLDDNVERLLEVGIGTGPNLKYYSGRKKIQKVVGVDPNKHMEKYASAAALAAGLSKSQFEFIQGIGEGLPVPNGSMDAVVCTLVLCSVVDLPCVLQEIKRVLKPGGKFLFVEHVAAPDGTGLRLWQAFLDPLQQCLADGCHLTRDTLFYIEQAQFGSLKAEMIKVSSVSLISPHVVGVAHMLTQRGPAHRSSSHAHLL